MGVRRPQQRRLHAPVRLVQSGASPDDPALGDYWARRRRKAPLPINNTNQRLLGTQDGRCPICKATLIAVDHRPQTPHQWEQWLANTRNTITIVKQETGTPDEAEPRLIHAHCHTSRGTALLPADEPVGLA